MWILQYAAGSRILQMEGVSECTFHILHSEFSNALECFIGDHPCSDQGTSAYLASSIHSGMVSDIGTGEVSGNLDTNLR